MDDGSSACLKEERRRLGRSTGGTIDKSRMVAAQFFFRIGLVHERADRNSSSSTIDSSDEKRLAGTSTDFGPQ